MATEDILIRYRADVSQLEADLNKLVDSQEQLTAATKQNTAEQTKAANSAEFAAKKRAQLLDQETKKLQQLKEAQKLAFDPVIIDKYNQQIAASQKRIETLGGTYKQAAKQAQDGNQQLLGGLTRIAGAFGVAFSVEALVNFGKQAVGAFLDAQEQADKLRFAITSIGGEGEDALARLNKQAQELADTTFFGDDDITAAQAALSAFGLTADQIEAVIPKLADFAAVTGGTVTDAANTLGGALEGRAGEFKRFGIEVDASATKAENLAKVTKGLAQQAGAAAAALDTTAGKAKDFKDQAGELVEEVGAGLVSFGSYLGGIFTTYWNVLRDALAPVIDAVVRFKNVIVGLIPDVVIDKLKEFFQGGEALKVVLETIAIPLKLTATLIGKWYDAIVQIVAGISGLVNVFREGFDQIGQTVTSVGAGISDVLNGIANFDTKKIQAGLTKVQGSFSKAGKDIANAFNEGYTSTLKLAEGTKKETDKVVEVAQQAAQKIFTSDELKKKSIQALNAELEKQKNIQGNAARQNVEAIEKELEARKKQGEAAKKSAEETIKLEAEKQKAIADTFAKYTDEFIKLRNEADQQLQDIEFTITLNTKGLAPAIEQFQKTAATNLEASIKQLQTQIDANPLAFDALTDDQKQALIINQFKSFVGQIDQAWAAGGVSIEDTSTNIAAALGPDFLALPFEEAIKLLPELAGKYLPQFKGQFKDTADEVITDADKIAKANEDAADRYQKSWLGANENILQDTVKLFGELGSLFQNITDSRIDELQKQTDAELKNLEIRQEANQEQFDNRAISEQQFLEEQTRIENERIALQEETAAREKEIKKQQFAVQQAIAVFEIGLATAKAIGEISAKIAAYQAGLPVTAPLLANAQFARILAIASGAAQIAAVLAQPKPYRKGSKDTGNQQHLARVGEEGEELVWMPANSKVLPARQTRKYSDIIDAMYDNKLDDYVYKNYITPALMAQKEAKENQRAKTFADNMASSIVYNQQGLTPSDLEAQRKRGQYIRNVDEIASAIAKKLPIRDIYRA